MALRATELQNLFGLLHYVFEKRKKAGVYILTFLRYHLILLGAVKTVRSDEHQLSEVTIRQYRMSLTHLSVSLVSCVGLRTKK